MSGYQLQPITPDSADAHRWRVVREMTGWQGSAAELAERYNDMAAQLAEYNNTQLVCPPSLFDVCLRQLREVEGVR